MLSQQSLQSLLHIPLPCPRPLHLKSSQMHPQSERHHLQWLPGLKHLRLAIQMHPLLESHHLQRPPCLKLLRVPHSDRGMQPSPIPSEPLAAVRPTSFAPSRG